MKNVIVIFMVIILTGCHNTGITEDRGNSATEHYDEEINQNMNNENTTTQIKQENVSAEEFMEYYSLTEDDVPKEYVQAFIDDGNITADDLTKGGGRIKEFLLEDYRNGVVYGYNIHKIFRGPYSSERLDDYMTKADVILFWFDIHSGSELVKAEFMVIDLKKGKIYFSHRREQEVTEDYINFELVAELSEKEVYDIRKDLPKHIEEDKGETTFGEYSDYSFRIKMTASDKTTKYYEGDNGDEEHFPGFDEYWKELYKKYFGKEYEFTGN